MICTFCGSEHGSDDLCILSGDEDSFPSAELEPELIFLDDLPPEPPPGIEVTAVWNGTPRELRATELGRGAAYLCAESDLPPLRSRVVLTVANGKVRVAAEVVRHVSPEESRAWRMPAGFAVQLLDVPEQVRDLLDRLGRGEHVEVNTPFGDDPVAAEVLKRLRPRLRGNAYEVLRLERTQPCSMAAERARALKAELEPLRARALSSTQRADVDALLNRTLHAEHILGTPGRRAALDGDLANWRGVRQCMREGLRADALELLRRDHLARHVGNEARAAAHLRMAIALERSGRLDDAFSECEQALSLDPLNILTLERHARLELERKKPGAAIPVMPDGSPAPRGARRAVIHKPTVRAMPSVSLAALASRCSGMTFEAFRTAWPCSWLVWEAGAWFPARQQMGTFVPPDPKALAGALTGEAMLIALAVADRRVGQVALGRASSCDISLNDATLSQMHLVFMSTDAQRWTVRDVGSRNGTSIEGRTIVPYRPEPLAEGARIVAGHVRLTYTGPQGLYARLRRLGS